VVLRAGTWVGGPQIIIENYARAVIKPLSDEDDAASSLLRIRVYVARPCVAETYILMSV
jgi:hypothetical protein